MTQLCDVCGEGQSSQATVYVRQEYNGHACDVATFVQVCNHCGSEYAGPVENKLNKRAMMAFRKRVDQLLTGEEIRAIRTQYGITQTQAALLFGGGPVAFSKYENDEVSQSEPMDNLLRVVRKSKEAFWTLVDEKDMRREIAGATDVASSSVFESSQITLNVGLQNAKDAVYEPKAFRRYAVGKVQEWKS